MYSPEQRAAAITAVLEGLAKGTPLTVICRQDGMPEDRTIRLWAEQDEELSSAIARAREAGFDALAVEALTIQDQEPEMAIGADGSSRRDSAWVAWQRNRVETRLKLLAKWDPKRYGEMIKHGNADGSNLDLAGMIAERRSKVAKDA